MQIINFDCGHKYPWVLEGVNNYCCYCAGQYPNGEKPNGGTKITLEILEIKNS